MRISAQQLEDFAPKEIAAGILPELMRRLIQATCEDIGDVRFPAGESTFRPGADGLLKAKGVDPYVPGGVSLWEVSTEKNPHAKFTKDIVKRSEKERQDEYLGVQRSDVTYVAVSMRRWHGTKKQGRDQFISHYSAEGVWKSIKVFDADDLENWLDRSPSVRAWLVRQMKLLSDETNSIDDFWSDYRESVSPALSENLLLLDRTEKAEATIDACMAGGVTRVKADSPNEAAAFVAAAITSLDATDPRRSFLLSKGIVITKSEAEIHFRDSSRKLLVIALGTAAEAATRLAAKGHTVLVAYGSSHARSGGNSMLIELPRARRQGFGDALHDMGVSQAQSRVLAARCHCSITVLFRIQDMAHSRLPTWASADELRSLVGPVFAGSWSHENDSDNRIVSQIAAREWYAVDEDVRKALVLDDAPVLRAGSLTSLSAPADMWQICIDRQVLTHEHFYRFREAVLEVLGELDPGLELTPQERLFARLDGKERKFSASLRRGLAEILRIIAVNEDNLTYLSPRFDAQNYVNQILSSVPGIADDHRILASLDSLLPDLAEAAPDPFLSALETLSNGDGAMLSPIFEGSDDAVYGVTHYLGMLRGLEVLAWDPARLYRVAFLLARLSELDPGGRLQNRPINSLAQIFLPWYPHTNADQRTRHSVLKALCETYSEVSWCLLSKLLPQVHGVSFGTSKPEWREFGSSARPEPTTLSVAQDNELIMKLAIPIAGVEASRWLNLLEGAAASGGDPLLSMVINGLNEVAEEVENDASRDQLWETLNAFIEKHQAFESAPWALPRHAIEELSSVLQSLRPEDPMILCRHLFDHHFVERLNAQETFEERRARTDAERDSAVRSIVPAGPQKLLEFALSVKAPALLAHSLIRVTDANFVREFVLLAYPAEGEVSWLAALLTGLGKDNFGLGWAQGIVEEVAIRSEEAAASLVRTWDDTRELLDYIGNMPRSFQNEYWCTRDTYVRSSDSAVVFDAVQQLMNHRRSLELHEFLGATVKKHETSLLLQVLENGLRDAVEDPQRLRKINTFWLREIFKALRDREDADRDQLMSFEYRWFPALHSYGEVGPFVLHEHLGESAEFFVEVISDLYKSDSAEGSQEEEEIEESERTKRQNRAEIAYKLLHSWQYVPWRMDSERIDFDRMKAWTTKALALAEEAGRFDVAAVEIGKLLAYAPTDADDGVWPDTAVRELVEELKSPELERSVVTELFNKRGVHTRAIDAGGAQERVLAKAASEAASHLEKEWPRTAALMRSNERQWLDLADREDRSVAERRISF